MTTAKASITKQVNTSQLSQYKAIDEVPAEDLTYKDMKFAPFGFGRDKQRLQSYYDKQAEQDKARKEKILQNSFNQ